MCVLTIVTFSNVSLTSKLKKVQQTNSKTKTILLYKLQKWWTNG